MSSMSFVGVLTATLRSFGVIFTLAFAGVYGERLEILTSNVTKGLGEVSMNITIPALLFTTLLGCKQNNVPRPCDSLETIIGRSWPFLFLPFLYVGFGAVVGSWMARLCKTERRLLPVFQASAAFGNATGLPIVLLTVIQSQFVQTSALGSTNPLPMLSVFLIFYPVLQWSFGSWLFRQADLSDSQWSLDRTVHSDIENPIAAPLLDNDSLATLSVASPTPLSPSPLPSPTPALTWRDIAKRSLQPPVIAVLLALFIGLVPDLRGLLVDTQDRNDDSPVQVVFDGIDRLGQAAVPINMLILGASLSRGLRSVDLGTLKSMSATLSGIVATKMLLLPLFSIALVYLMSLSAIFSGTSRQTLFLVMMVVAAMPTSNSMTVIAELNCSKDTVSMLSMIVFVQYIVGVVLLPSAVCVMVMVAQSL